VRGTCTQLIDVVQTSAGETLAADIVGSCSQRIGITQLAVGTTLVRGSSSQQLPLTQAVSGTVLITGGVSQSLSVTQSVVGEVRITGFVNPQILTVVQKAFAFLDRITPEDRIVTVDVRTRVVYVDAREREEIQITEDRAAVVDVRMRIVDADVRQRIVDADGESMSKKKWPPKDPDETLDYGIRWTDELTESNDTISSFTTTIVNNTDTDPLVINSSGQDNGLITVWFSGGETGVTYEVLSHIVTAGGRTMEQTIRLPVKER